jgi:CheY-like chemotaxis protein
MATIPRILVAEDVDMVRTLIKGLLTSHGFKVIEAIDGVQALSTVRQQEIDLVLADVQMPNLDGLQLCRMMKADPRLKTIPVVLLTGKRTDAARVEAERVGAAAFLSKPVVADDLEAALEKLLKR